MGIDFDDPSRVEETMVLWKKILREVGVEDPRPDSVFTAPAFNDGPSLLSPGSEFDKAMFRFVFEAGCLPYTAPDLAFLTLFEVCQKYVRDSFPPPPSDPLTDDDHAAAAPNASRTGDHSPVDFPITFVLGAPRSGTTIFRAMLDIHPDLWAPGELQLANFDTMAGRAIGLIPHLRHSVVPELAERFGEPIAQFGRRFVQWEQDATPTTEVFRQIHEANEQQMIVDKTPPYSGSVELLEAIDRHFPNARYIHLVRNPFDVIRSFVATRLYAGSAHLHGPNLAPHHQGEVMWTRHNRNITSALAGIDPERQVRLRYEDLMTEPVGELERVTTTLGVSVDVAMADPYKNASGVVAKGAGDMKIYAHRGLAAPAPSEAFFPLGERSSELAERLGYAAS